MPAPARQRRSHRILTSIPHPSAPTILSRIVPDSRPRRSEILLPPAQYYRTSHVSPHNPSPSAGAWGGHQWGRPMTSQERNQSLDHEQRACCFRTSRLSSDTADFSHDSVDTELLNSVVTVRRQAARPRLPRWQRCVPCVPSSDARRRPLDRRLVLFSTPNHMPDTEHCARGPRRSHFRQSALSASQPSCDRGPLLEVTLTEGSLMPFRSGVSDCLRSHRRSRRCFVH